MGFPTHWLDRMLAHHDKYPNAILTPISVGISEDGAFSADSMWGTGCGMVKAKGPIGHPQGMAARWGFVKDETAAASVQIPAPMGACYLVPRSVLDDIGGWSMGLTEWGCDEEFASARAWLSGNEVRVCLDFAVAHRYTRDLEALERIDSKTGKAAPDISYPRNSHYMINVLFGKEEYYNTYRYPMFQEGVGRLRDITVLMDDLEEDMKRDHDAIKRVMTHDEYWALMDKLAKENFQNFEDTKTA